jgi:hypothetical protein
MRCKGERDMWQGERMQWQSGVVGTRRKQQHSGGDMEYKCQWERGRYGKAV